MEEAVVENPQKQAPSKSVFPLRKSLREKRLEEEYYCKMKRMMGTLLLMRIKSEVMS